VKSPADFRGDFRTDDVARALYSEGAGIFRVLPRAVAVPQDLDDLVALIRWAGETATPLVPRGAGSGMAGGNVGPGVVVDLTRGFAQPPVVDPAAHTARAGAAVTYRALNEAAARHGLFLPPDPASGKFCTLGGMVSTNASGPHSLKYGAMRGWVTGLQFVTADGETGSAEAGGEEPPTHVRTAAEERFYREAAPAIERDALALAAAVPHTPKNSSGYDLPGWARSGDLTRLLVGSEGTLVVVTAVEVALAPLPARTSTILVALRSLEDVGPAVLALLPLEPSAVELMDRTYLDFVQASAHRSLPDGTEAVLLAEFEGDGAGAAEALTGIASAIERADDPAAVADLWELRHLASPILTRMPDDTRSLQLVEDGCVPVQRLGAYIASLRDIAGRHGFRIVIFGHAGDGHLHANVIADVRAPDLVQRLAACLDDVTSAQLALGGTPSGEHGDGRLRAPYLARTFGEPYAALCRKVKEAWDPAGILNPGVVVAPPGARPLDLPLKVGLAAPPIPPAVAERLRRIEREAGWGSDLLGTNG
jgi:FAD/FMN-containing dehydrogenase